MLFQTNLCLPTSFNVNTIKQPYQNLNLFHVQEPIVQMDVREKKNPVSRGKCKPVKLEIVIQTQFLSAIEIYTFEAICFELLPQAGRETECKSIQKCFGARTKICSSRSGGWMRKRGGDCVSWKKRKRKMCMGGRAQVASGGIIIY